MRRGSSGWLERVYPHNPLYLVSVVLVLWGLQIASGRDPTAMGLRTPLLFAYIVMLAAAGWLVVRFGRVWQDARTILLAVLLMFAALSTSYDKLCLDDADAGAARLASAFAFSVAVVESMLLGLRLRFPLAYRVPFYLQLGVLFAFPAYLGRLSIDGHSPAMVLSVLGYSFAAGASLLTLLPAIWSRSLVEGRNGTPWRWPYYPWSIFVFVAITMGVRSWMLSVSFTHAKGVDAAFGLYFLTPILLAICVIVLEAGLRHGSKPAQAFANGLLAALPLMAFPGEQLSRAQRLSLDLIESQAVGPPLAACVVVAIVAAYGLVRRAAGSWSLLLGVAVLASCVDPDTRSLRELHAPHTVAMLPVVVWVLYQGVRSLDASWLAIGTGAALFLAGWRFEVEWLTEQRGVNAAMLWAGITLALPLFCRDALSALLREAGPALFAVASPVALAAFPPPWWSDLPEWGSAVLVAALAGYSVAYWLSERAPWRLLAGVWSGLLAGASGASLWLDELGDPQLRNGLAVYALGCAVLLVALAVSLAKAGVAARLGTWLVAKPPREEPGPG